MFKRIVIEMKNLLEILGTFLYCQWKAPQIMMDLPSYSPVKITKVTKHASELIPDDWDEDEMQIVPKHISIDYEFKDRFGSIWLNIEEDSYHMTGPDLMEDEYLGSAGLGIVVFGLPSIILTLPLWATTGLIIGLMEHLCQMNRHSLSLWLRLKNQLDPETQQHFKNALRKSYGDL